MGEGQVTMEATFAHDAGFRADVVTLLQAQARSRMLLGYIFVT